MPVKKLVSIVNGAILTFYTRQELYIISPSYSMMGTAKITDKGQVTIPKEIREEFHLHSGVKVEFTVEEGKLILNKVRSNAKLMESYGVVQVNFEEYDCIMGEIRPKPE